MKLFDRVLNPREIRRRLGLNQEQFWTQIGVTQSGGSRYESGREMPKPVRELLRLVHVEQVDLSQVKRVDFEIISYLKDVAPRPVSKPAPRGEGPASPGTDSGARDLAERRRRRRRFDRPADQLDGQPGKPARSLTLTVDVAARGARRRRALFVSAVPRRCASLPKRGRIAHFRDRLRAHRSTRTPRGHPQ